MPSLWKLMKRRISFILLFLLIVVFFIDISMKPTKQISVRLYSKMIDYYQTLCRPLLKGHIQCRYCPTCSEFSKQAVLIHSFAKGMFLSIRRIFSCTINVPLGTIDPVPNNWSEAKSYLYIGGYESNLTLHFAKLIVCNKLNQTK